MARREATCGTGTKDEEPGSIICISKGKVNMASLSSDKRKIKRSCSENERSVGDMKEKILRKCFKRHCLTWMEFR